jgi:hypothetical protein
MTDSTDARRGGAVANCCAAGLLALALALAAAPAAAQQDGDAAVGEPLQLGPADDSDGADDAGGAAGGSGGGADQDAAAPEGIEVDRLEELDLETTGPLDAGNGGLPADMWADTPRRVVAALLPRLPGDLSSPALRDLARRLLLTSSAPPVRRQADGADADLLALRVQRLALLGPARDLNALMQVLPRDTGRPQLARTKAEGLFLAHRHEAACKIVRAAVGARDATFWQKAQAVCQLAEGARDAANLTLGLLREQGVDDPALFALANAVEQGAETAPEGLQAPGALHLALIQAGDLEVPAALLADAPAPTLAALATSSAQSVELRAAAAQAAVERGILPPALLRERLAAVDLPDARVRGMANGEAAARPGDDMTPARRRALLYQGLRAADTPVRRAELAEALFAAPDTRGHPARFLATARLLAPELAALPAQPDLVWFAATAGRALYAADRPEAAGRWLRMAQQEAIINPKAAAAVTALWPYAELSGAQEVPANGGLGVWRQAQDGANAGDLAIRQSVLRAVLEGLGLRPERRWIEIVLDGPAEDRSAPSTALLYALREAGEAGRIGETVLLSLLVLGGNGGLGACHPAALGQTVAALRAAGLEHEARRIAVEAAVFNGI